MYGEPQGVVTWKTGCERMRSYAGMDVEVPRRLENEMAGAALEALLSSRAASISDSSSVDEANEESLMIKLLKLGRFVSSRLLWNQTSDHHTVSPSQHLPSSLHVANKPG
jgi:hypothetical protein